MLREEWKKSKEQTAESRTLDRFCFSFRNPTLFTFTSHNIKPHTEIPYRHALLYKKWVFGYPLQRIIAEIKVGSMFSIAVYQFRHCTFASVTDAGTWVSPDRSDHKRSIDNTMNFQPWRRTTSLLCPSLTPSQQVLCTYIPCSFQCCASVRILWRDWLHTQLLLVLYLDNKMAYRPSPVASRVASTVHELYYKIRDFEVDNGFVSYICSTVIDCDHL